MIAANCNRHPMRVMLDEGAALAARLDAATAAHADATARLAAIVQRKAAMQARLAALQSIR